MLEKDINPVALWLKDLSTNVEVEYLNTLQSKSVATTEEAFEAFVIRECQITVQQIRKSSQKVVDGLDYFIDQIPLIYSDLKLLKSSFAQINCEIRQIVIICRKKFVDYTPDRNKLLDYVWRGSQQIHKLIDFFVTKKNVNNSQLESTLRKVKENFGELVNHLIKNESKVITEALVTKRESGTGGLAVKWSLMSCCAIANNDAYICRIFTQCHRVVRPLLNIVTNPWLESLPSSEQRQQIKALAIKLLTILCVNGDAANQLLEECIYSQFLSSIIYGQSSDIVVKEAVDLLVQMTKKLMDSDNQFAQFIQILVNDFVHCLTKVMATNSQDSQITLLCLTAVANVSFVDLDCLIENNMLAIILGQLAHMADDILVRDQMVTIVANIARKYQLEVVSSGGLVFIINTLQLKADDFKTKEELAAFERIQQKVCVAIARLATNKSITQIFFRLNVVKQLIQICKEPKQRNFSQNVLIASMAALKRLAKVSQLNTVQ